jgi:hypothetical protein
VTGAGGDDFDGPDPDTVDVVMASLLVWALLVTVFGPWWGNLTGVMASTWFIYGPRPGNPLD